jgi:replicative DNA helicase
MSEKTEQLFLSAVLRQEDHVSPVLAGVTAKWFSAYPEEWSWVLRYIDRHRRCPSKTLFKSKFTNFQLVNSDDVEYCLAELKDEFVSRSLVKVMDEALDNITDSKDPAKILESLQSELVGIQADAVGSANESDVVDDWESVYNEVTRRQERAQTTGMSGIPTGFPTLDAVTNGPQEGDYWIVAARLGQGKTWTLIRMAATAIYHGATVQYDALEQSRNQIAMRAHTFLQSDNALTSFTAAELLSGKNLDLIQYKKFLKGLKDELPGKLIVNDTSRGSVTPSTIAAQIERNKPDIVFIDYLTLMGGSGDWQAISALSGEMKGLAMKYKVPIVAAAQINRASIGTNHPGAEHLSGSDSIGQDADCVVTMQQMSRHVIRMHLAKYRHGMDGQMWFNEFRPNSGSFTEISGDDAQDIMSEDKLELLTDD